MLRMGKEGLNMINGNYLARDIKSAWKQFTTKFDIDDGVTRPEIADSWKHCYKVGVDPFGNVEHLNLNQQDIEKLLEEKRNLLNIAQSIITDLYCFVAGSGYVVMLSDERGYIMEIMGDSDTMANASRYNLSKGAIWAEEKVGTNGIGTALAIKKPIQVSGAEHYCQKNHFWTCSAAPILDNNKQIIGVLQISGPSSKTHQHTLGMVVSAVKSIGNQIRLQQTNMELILLNNRLNNIILTVSDGIIVTNKEGMIIQVNPIAENILVRKEHEIIGSSVMDFTNNASVIKGILSTGEVFKNYELIVNSINHSIHCLSTGKPTKDNLDNITGAVIFIKPLNKTTKLDKRFNGAHATFQFEDIVGENKQLKKTIELGKIAAGNISHVVLQGDSGTGKEVFAQAIHNMSSRRNKAFVAINCGAIPRELIGSELFGYEGGSFTGAKQEGRPGKFELASGGTLFLDEIGDMPLEHQVALLRVLQDQRITRIGGGKTLEVDVRIICATNKNLRLEVAKGNFREDLFYRLNVISITMPPLRERREDIPLLFDLFSKKICKKLGINFPYIDPKVFSYFRQYEWPGNVRELQNVVERILNLANGQSISIEHLPEEILNPHPVEASLEDLPYSTIETIAIEKYKIKELLNKNEYKEIMSTILAANGNLSKVARDMGISRNTLYKKLKRLNISIR
jgi:sigma-54 dependent transcriptional regulator, acetoin dehydrogenase operon transcriptional activator AcoR